MPFYMRLIALIGLRAPPSPNERSSYEELTHTAPKVMGIYPFGCRMYAVKPRSAYSKSNFDARAWVGFNLGRCSSIPGAYNIWVPELRRIVTTSDAYVDETLFPWLPEEHRRVALPVPHAVADNSDQPPGIHPSQQPAVTSDASPSSPATMSQAYADATSRASSRAASSRSA